jgi:hypothetical protein
MDILHGQLFPTIIDLHQHLSLPIVDILAQKIEDPDILGQIQTAWTNFLKSGQGWALLIGMFFGYTFKGFTG